MPAGHVLAVMLLALLMGLFFNADDILRTAQRQPAGPMRSVGVGLAEPVAAAAAVLRLDRPRLAIDIALGRVPAETTPPSTAPVPPPSSTVPSTTVPEVRIFSEDNPLRMYVGGDSMVGQFGPMLANLAEDSGPVRVDVRYEFESGLTRPDYIDWNTVLSAVEDSLDPEVVVLFFGGNDAQDIRIEGVWEPFGTDRWIAEYRSRVARVMDDLEARGAKVWWVGMPIVRSESFRGKLAILNEIYKSEAQSRDNVFYVDSWTPFTGPDGAYAEFLPDADGDVVDMRLNDGVHFTTDGGIKLASIVWEQITGEIDLG